MKRINGLFILASFLLATVGWANDEADDGRAMIQTERENVVRSELHMSATEAEKFWPIYSSYRKDHDEIMVRYGAMIREYMRRYDDADLSNEYADEMIDSYFEIKEELLTVQLEFLPQFRAVLPAMKVARFYQLENKINVEIDAQIAQVVPLVDPS